MKCSVCGSDMVDMIYTSFCKNDCDRKSMVRQLVIGMRVRVTLGNLSGGSDDIITGKIVAVTPFISHGDKYNRLHIARDDMGLNAWRLVDGTPYDCITSDANHVEILE